MSELKSFGSDVEDAISRVRVPAYLIDKHGIIRSLNPAARSSWVTFAAASSHPSSHPRKRCGLGVSSPGTF
jgi:hypothetical protein